MKISKRVWPLITLLASSVRAQSMPDSRYDANGIDQYGLSRYRIVEDETYYRTWINLPWQSDGKEFLTVRQVVNRLGAKKQLAPKLSLWEKQALSSPKNAIFQFRYAIAAYRLALDKQKVGDVDPNLIRKLAWRLSLPENPRAYQYDRLRFLLYCEARADSSILPLAKRLQDKDPKDTHVSYWLSILRVSSGDISYLESLTKNAKDEVQKHPKDPEKRISLAGGYFRLWGMTNRRFYAEAAVEQYKQFLRLYPNTPPNMARRKKIQRWITSIPEDQADLEKKGVGKP